MPNSQFTALRAEGGEEKLAGEARGTVPTESPGGRAGFHYDGKSGETIVTSGEIGLDAVLIGRLEKATLYLSPNLCCRA